MSAERKQRLDAIGFVWDPLESAWEEGFAALNDVQSARGSLPRAYDHVEGTFKLGRWVGHTAQ